MKKALTNTLIYYILAGALYAISLASPEQIGFYGLMLFFLIHLPGRVLMMPFYTHGVDEPAYLGHVVAFALISVNAAAVFLISWFWVRSRKPRANDA